MVHDACRFLPPTVHPEPRGVNRSESGDRARCRSAVRGYCRDPSPRTRSTPHHFPRRRPPPAQLLPSTACRTASLPRFRVRVSTGFKARRIRHDLLDCRKSGRGSGPRRDRDDLLKRDRAIGARGLRAATTCPRLLRVTPRVSGRLGIHTQPRPGRLCTSHVILRVGWLG